MITNELLKQADKYIKSQLKQRRAKNKDTGIPVDGIPELLCCLKLIQKQLLYRSGHSAWEEAMQPTLQPKVKPTVVVPPTVTVVPVINEVVKPC